MRKVTLDRIESDQYGTFGRVSTDTFYGYSLERPKDGEFPCIPAGVYKISWKTKAVHPVKGPCYEVMNVKDRTAILIHPANWFDQLLGCIALGRSIDNVLRKDGSLMKGITSSKDAVTRFEDDLEIKDAELTIRWVLE